VVAHTDIYSSTSLFLLLGFKDSKYRLSVMLIISQSVFALRSDLLILNHDSTDNILGSISDAVSSQFLATVSKVRSSKPLPPAYFHALVIIYMSLFFILLRSISIL